jgi:hypothetical protein
LRHIARIRALYVSRQTDNLRLEQFCCAWKIAVLGLLDVYDD